MVQKILAVGRNIFFSLERNINHKIGDEGRTFHLAVILFKTQNRLGFLNGVYLHLDILKTFFQADEFCVFQKYFM